MTPYEIELLLHIFTRPNPLEDIADTPLRGQTIQWFLDQEFKAVEVAISPNTSPNL